MAANRRADVTARAVADRYLEGHSYLALAVLFDCETTLIQTRLKEARQLYPDLPWASRTPRRGLGATAEYVRMNDGQVGARDVAGSIARARRRR